MLLFHAIKEKHNAREEYSCDQYITHTQRNVTVAYYLEW